jgi:hypothetical protein
MTASGRRLAISHFSASNRRRKPMWDEVSQLNDYHGDVAVGIRLLKLTDEIGNGG